VIAVNTKKEAASRGRGEMGYKVLVGNSPEESLKRLLCLTEDSPCV